MLKSRCQAAMKWAVILTVTYATVSSPPSFDVNAADTSQPPGQSEPAPYPTVIRIENRGQAQLHTKSGEGAQRLKPDVWQGLTSLQFVRRVDGEESKTMEMAILSFDVRSGDGFRIVNDVRISADQFSALMTGDTVQPITDGINASGPIGYGTPSDTEDVISLTWRWPEAVQLRQSRDGRARLTVSLGPESDLDGHEKTASSASLTIEGTLDVSCIDEHGRVDVMFRGTQFCAAILNQTPELRGYIPALAPPK